MARAKAVDKTADIYIAKNPNNEDPEKKLKSLEIWDQIKRQFSQSEQKVFIEHWNGLISQFHGDVVYAEYLQITELIKLELLANRVLEGQQSCQDAIARLERLIQSQMDKEENQRDHRLLEGYESSIVSNREAISSLRNNYLNLVEKKEKALNGLKATRQQRYQAIENSKSSMLDWYKLVITDESLRKRLGIEAAKFRLAMEQEKERLSAYHTYLDGEVELPLLNSETILEKEGEVVNE